jgi:hypothetical protein
MNYFESKVKFMGVDDAGRDKQLVKNLLFEAENFTDAEAIVTDKMNQVSNQFFIQDIKRSKISTVIADDMAAWYKAKVAEMDVDEHTGKQKKISVYVLASADDTEHANQVINKVYEKSPLPFEVESISLTNITDVL